VISQAVPEEFWQGVEQFNQGQFYACHDTLEALWMEASEPQRTFYQGILQIAVSLYHLSNCNWRGAVILLGEGINKLQRYSPTHAGIDVAELVTSSAALLAKLQNAGPEKIGDWVVSNGARASEDEALRLPKIMRID
jgi:predicted metal-dependent hydrolase